MLVLKHFFSKYRADGALFPIEELLLRKYRYCFKSKQIFSKTFPLKI